MAEIKLEKAELEAVVQLEEGIKECHMRIGFLREKEAHLLSRLINLRERAMNWENQIGAKYHLPQGVKWALNPNTGVVAFEEKKEGEPAEPAPQNPESKESS